MKAHTLFLTFLSLNAIALVGCSKPAAESQPMAPIAATATSAPSSNGDKEAPPALSPEEALAKLEAEPGPALPADTAEAIESVRKAGAAIDAGTDSFGDYLSPVYGSKEKFLGKYPMFDVSPNCQFDAEWCEIGPMGREEIELSKALAGLPFVLNADVNQSPANGMSCSAVFCSRDVDGTPALVGRVQPAMVDYMKRFCEYDRNRQESVFACDY